MSSILDIENVSVSLDGSEILKDVSFEIEEGDHVAIVGPNGSGKTVLLKTLLGILPHTGDILWRPGVRLGYVPQKVDADRHLPLTLENLLSAKAHIAHLRTQDITAVTETLQLTPKLLKTPVGHLSGGQFQKALIAFALLGKPEVILFDEPTASLDQLAEERIYDLLHELQDKYGLTILIVSHDLSVVSQYATKVLCLNKEKICFGTPEEALKPETLAKLYGAPQKFFHHLHGHDH